jgi:hypothetical protein
MQPLVEAVERWRQIIPDTPDFDPAGGGIEANTLFLLEAPSNKASTKHGKGSGFVCMNNDDRTAENVFNLTREARMPRELSCTWNAFAGYVGTETRLRAPKASEIDANKPQLIELIELLPKLRVVMTLGLKAKAAWNKLLKRKSTILHGRKLVVIHARHPSQLSLNQRPGARQALLASYRKAAELARRDTPPRHAYTAIDKSRNEHIGVADDWTPLDNV